jgi:hypothetical protein
MDVTAKMEQGNIKDLFPNLGMEVITNGCVCQIIQISYQQIKVEITEAINPMYKVGNQIWVDSFLIPSDEKEKN